MKIDLKALGLIKTNGYLIRGVDLTRSGTNYGDPVIQINEIYYQEITGVIAGERLGTQNNVWIPYKAFSTPIVIDRSDKLLINLWNQALTLPITQILNLSDDEAMKLIFDPATNIYQILKNNWVNIINATNSTNNGLFNVLEKATLADTDPYINIKNINGDNEFTTSAQINYIFNEFKIDDTKREIHSFFKDHYQLTIYERNT